MVVNALKTIIEEDFQFHSPKNDYVVIEEWIPEDNPKKAKEGKDWVDITVKIDNPKQT
jgi:hypothetical protein